MIYGDDFVTIKGNVLLAGADEPLKSFRQTIFKIDYPEGFNKDNTVALAFDVNSTSVVTTYNFGFTPPSLSVIATQGTFPRTIGFGDEQITCMVYNSVTERTIKYRIVLMKIPEVNTTGYELGDVNMDGQVTNEDKTLVENYLNQTGALTDKQFKLADMNSDGIIDSSDLLAIQRKINNNS